MHHVLFVTDDWDQKKRLRPALLDGGFRLSQIASPELFTETFTPPDKLDIVVADLERCLTESAKLCHALKRETALKELPLVLLLTEEQLVRIDLGWAIDDYLTLPASPARLVQRLRFLVWKLHRVSPKNGFSHGELAIDFERYEVHVQGVPVDLTYKEFELLKFLVANAGKAFTREVLLNKVWGYDYYGGTRTVDVHIRRLRSKIELGSASYIETVRNVGYKFVAEAITQ
ncbi:MAG: response regulator transcription factor [Candidatus Omnitrophota bacterium]|nr:response regulator transcription factor [Candidatus Omnitrophota bacterium]